MDIHFANQHISAYANIENVNWKGKVHPRTGHEGPEGV
jgi:hypothetical protein